MIDSFEKIIHASKCMNNKRTAAVAGAADTHVLQAVARAKEDGIAEAILLGNGLEIEKLLRTLGQNPADYEIVDCAGGAQCGMEAVRMVREQRANFLMKGLVETRDLLKPVVNKETGISADRIMSHFALNELPDYHKFIVNTDGGMIIYPTLEEKCGILRNAVETLHRLGNACPKVAVLAGVEKVNPKMKETVDADALKQMSLRGEITGCVVEGPISYDLAMSAETAKIKGYDCSYCGDFDVLLQPDLVCGNVLGKSWYMQGHGKMAGIIVGAKVPIVLTSRGASSEEKYLSIALAAVTAPEGV